MYNHGIKISLNKSMKKFLVMYRMDMAEIKNYMATKTDEDRKADMAEWNGWMQENAAHFADAGGPLGKNLQVSAAGASEISNDLAGYSIVNAESKEAVAELLANSPHLKMPGATTDVMEVVQMS